MQTADLEKYCEKAIAAGVTHAKVIDPGSVVTAAWVRMKCLFGCPYGSAIAAPRRPPPRRRPGKSSIVTSEPSCFTSRRPGLPSEAGNLGLFDILGKNGRRDLQGRIFRVTFRLPGGPLPSLQGVQQGKGRLLHPARQGGKAVHGVLRDRRVSDGTGQMDFLSRP